MPHVAARSFLGLQVPIVLRNRRFIHGGTKVGRIGQILGKGVVGEKAETVGISAPDVDVAGVVPALRGIFQKVDGAYRKRFALYDCVCTAWRQLGSGNKRQRLEGSARSQWTR